MVTERYLKLNIHLDHQNHKKNMKIVIYINKHKYK